MQLEDFIGDWIIDNKVSDSIDPMLEVKALRSEFFLAIPIRKTNLVIKLILLS